MNDTHKRGSEVPPPPTAEDIARAEDLARRTKERLLSAPALTKAELVSRGVDPNDPTLIRLERPDGTEQWPAFQFGPDDQPHEVVQDVNQLLEVEDDPWGVADWWLGYNGWLQKAPEHLIGQVDNQELIATAGHELSEDHPRRTDLAVGIAWDTARFTDMP